VTNASTIQSVFFRPWTAGESGGQVTTSEIEVDGIDQRARNMPIIYHIRSTQLLRPIIHHIKSTLYITIALLRFGLNSADFFFKGGFR
jgi:hypothetical protein